jgi:Leucine-rich repeat (LRR) protein
MAEQTRSLHVKSKIKNSSSQPQNIPRNEDNLSLLRTSKGESTEIRCGPIHTPHRPLTYAPDPSEPAQTPPQPSFLTDRYFKECRIDPVKTPHASAEDQDLVAAQKKLVEKEKDLSMKGARKLKRDSQEYESVDVNNYNNSAQSDSISTSMLFSLPLNFMTRDTSTASTNVSTASPAARPFDDGRCVRAALLEELKTYEDLMKINDNATNSSSATHPNLNQVASLLDSMSKMGFYPQKRKLDLKDLNLTCKDIPVRVVCQRPFGDRLHKLILKGNKLSSVPPQLVLDLHGLHTLDLQQCGLTKLPSKWNLGSLRRLIVSHNKLQDFLEEDALRGLPQLKHLDFYDNNLHELILPMSKNQVLTKLEYLNLGFNQLARLPEELTLLTSLRVLKVSNNLIEHVPKYITDMNLNDLEVTSNPIVQPPLEDCERGICAMRRYYRGLGGSSSPSRTNDTQASATEYSSFSPPVSRSLGKKFLNTVLPFAFSGKKVKERQRESKDRISLTSSTLVERDTALSSASTTSDRVKLDGDTTTSKNKDNSNLSPFGRVRQQNSAVLSPSHDLKLRYSKEFQPQLPLPLQASPSAYSTSTGMKGSIYDEEKYDEFLMSEIIEQDHSTKFVPVNDTLKVIFVGMAYTGKTSLIRRLKYGIKATVPKNDERTIGVDVYDWDPTQSDEHAAQSCGILDTSIIGEKGKIPNTSVKFSVWDFAGQHVYHVSESFLLCSNHNLATYKVI